MNRIDYLLAAAPVYQTDQLQRVFSSAARLLLRVPKFDRDLRTKVRDRFTGCEFLKAYRTNRALHGIVPNNLAELCVPVFIDAYRSHLRSADEKKMKVQRQKLATYGSRSFGVAGPTAWNSRQVNLRNENLSSTVFKRT